MELMYICDYMNMSYGAVAQIQLIVGSCEGPFSLF